VEIGESDKPLAVESFGWLATINRRHPAVAVVLERFDDDPVWLAFLVSAVITALNEELVEVTDVDEAWLLHRLAEHVVKSVVNRSGGA